MNQIHLTPQLQKQKNKQTKPSLCCSFYSVVCIIALMQKHGEEKNTFHINEMPYIHTCSLLAKSRAQKGIRQIKLENTNGQMHKYSFLSMHWATHVHELLCHYN